MPQAGKAFFSRLSSLMRGVLYVAAASDKQRGGRIRPHIKIPPNLKTGLEGS